MTAKRWDLDRALSKLRRHVERGRTAKANRSGKHNAMMFRHEWERAQRELAAKAAGKEKS